MRSSFSRRLIALEAKYAPHKAANCWRGVPTDELIRNMTPEERQNLRQAILRLPDIERGSDEYRQLEMIAAASFDGAYNRIEKLA